MICNHSNPAFHRYCVTCGCDLQRLACPRCGAVCDNKYLYCYACGQNLQQAAPQQESAPVLLAHTYDLDSLAQVPVNHAVKIEKTAGKITQDEIKKLLAARQKKT